MTTLRKRARLATALAAVLALGLLINDRVEVAARELVVLNRTGQPAIVLVGARREEVGDAPLRLALGEGSHELEVQVGQGAPRAIQVELRGTVLSRLLGGRVCLLNLDAAAPILWEESIYGPPGGATPSDPRVSLGELLEFTRVDDLFVPFPEEGSGPRVRIGVAPGEPETILGALPPAARAEPGALSYAEHHLTRAPGSDALLRLYRDAAAAGASQRGASFLARRVGLRPVEEAWHRAYQDLRRASGELEALRAEYAAWVVAAPLDAPLRVLKGRVSDGPDQALEHYQAALRLDPDYAYAHYGVAVHLFRRAEYAAARAHVDAACSGRPQDPDFAQLRYLVRCGQGEWSALARELGQALEHLPTSLALFERHQEALLASSQPEPARAAFQTFRQRWTDRDDPRQLELLARACVFELHGEWSELRKLLPQLVEPQVRARLSFRAALGAGAPAEAGPPTSPAEALQLALAWSVHDPAQAPAARAACVTACAQGGGDWPLLGEALTAGDPAPLLKLALSPEDKACALLLLARERAGDAREPLRALARRYAIGLRHPHALLVAALAD